MLRVTYQDKTLENMINRMYSPEELVRAIEASSVIYDKSRGGILCFVERVGNSAYLWRSMAKKPKL